MPQTSLRRSLGLTSALSIVIGAVVGSGIFLKAWTVARAVPGDGWVYGLWGGIGLICLFGAFAYAELGAMFPEAGGQYAFLREAWGRKVAFLYGWTFLTVINSGTLAALAAAFAESLGAAFHISGSAQLAASALMILGLAIVNHFGVGAGAILQNVSTAAKLLALGTLVVGGVWLVAAGAPVEPGPVQTTTPPLSSGLIAAAMAIFWGYEGWYQLPFNAAELRNPSRDLPRGLVGGLVVIIVTYLAVNWVYLQAVPIEQMRALPYKEAVSDLTVSRIFGPGFGPLLTMVIAISVLGAANPNLLSSPRALYAMAQDGLAPHVMLGVHPKWQTPTWAIWSQALWAVLLVLVLRTFQDLTVYVVFASLLFYALTVAGVFRLRKHRPDLPRSYRTWGYPITPLLFIGVTLLTVLGTLTDPVERKNALVGLLMLGSGLPVFWWLDRRTQATAALPSTPEQG